MITLEEYRQLEFGTELYRVYTHEDGSNLHRVFCTNIFTDPYRDEENYKRLSDGCDLLESPITEGVAQSFHKYYVYFLNEKEARGYLIEYLERRIVGMQKEIREYRKQIRSLYRGA